MSASQRTHNGTPVDTAPTHRRSLAPIVDGPTFGDILQTRDLLPSLRAKVAHIPANINEQALNEILPRILAEKGLGIYDNHPGMPIPELEAAMLRGGCRCRMEVPDSQFYNPTPIAIPAQAKILGTPTVQSDKTDDIWSQFPSLSSRGGGSSILQQPVDIGPGMMPTVERVEDERKGKGTSTEQTRSRKRNLSSTSKPSRTNLKRQRRDESRHEAPSSQPKASQPSTSKSSDEHFELSQRNLESANAAWPQSIRSPNSSTKSLYGDSTRALPTDLPSPPPRTKLRHRKGADISAEHMAYESHLDRVLDEYRKEIEWSSRNLDFVQEQLLKTEAQAAIYMRGMMAEGRDVNALKPAKVQGREPGRRTNRFPVVVPPRSSSLGHRGHVGTGGRTASERSKGAPKF